MTYGYGSILDFGIRILDLRYSVYNITVLLPQSHIAGIHRNRLAGGGLCIGCQIYGCIRNILRADPVAESGGFLQLIQDLRHPVDKAGINKSRSNGIDPDFRRPGPGQGFGNAGQSRFYSDINPYR